MLYGATKNFVIVILPRFEMLSKKRTFFLGTAVGLSCVEWGLLLSLLSTFYPSEAENKGATASEVYSVIST